MAASVHSGTPTSVSSADTSVSSGGVSSEDSSASPELDRRISWVTSAPFFAMHITALVGLYFFELTWQAVVLVLAMYFIRMFGVTAGYHRYFSHRAFRTGRVMQFLLAVLAQTSAQKGALWWASHHRIHHKHSDQEGDVHSAQRDGFFWSHVGWIICHAHEDTDMSKIKDLAKYPELRWLNKYHLVPPVAVAVITYFVGGLDALYWGMCMSTVLLWHGTFTINSLTHIFGKRRYATTDNSKNHWLLALITMGEGWHNNHHYYQRAANQGFYWWEIDITYYVLRIMQALRLVRDVHVVPKHVRESNRIESTPAEPGATEPAPAAPMLTQTNPAA